jgi:hypothetical protein
MAPALKVSEADRTVVRPCFCRRFASLAMLVVFPVPLIPTNMLTTGLAWPFT